MIMRIVLLGGVVAAGCSGSSEPQPEPVPITLNEPGAAEPEEDVGSEGIAGGEMPAAAVEGTPCTRFDDCEQGEICAGPEGCDVVWTCQPSRACTRDLVTYCGCDGQTMQGSGSCPPGPYSRRGEC